MTADNTVRTVDKALDILFAFESAHQSQGMTVRDLEAALGQPKSSLYRLLSALERRGLVEHRDDRYFLGLRLYELGSLVVRCVNLVDAARPVMTALARAVDETAVFSVYEGGETVYLERVESPNPFKMVPKWGVRMPAYCVGTGKVLLAWQSQAEIERVLAAGLHPYTARTITDPRRMREELQQIRTHGYGIHDEECHEGVYSVAAPIRDHTGTVIAAIGVSGLTIHVMRDRERFIHEALQAARDISGRLGWRDGVHQARVEG